MDNSFTQTHTHTCRNSLAYTQSSFISFFHRDMLMKLVFLFGWLNRGHSGIRRPHSILIGCPGDGHYHQIGCDYSGMLIVSD